MENRLIASGGGSLLTHCHRGHKWPFPKEGTNSDMVKWFGQAVMVKGNFSKLKYKMNGIKNIDFFFLIKILGFL